ncbi:putative quinol monooxygenase [Sphingomonas sp. Root710]|uniref:putative quinol monooxygenase n=1 Tax=Sphingomonas sp. Root710 TaxID=1736594 RepID=UPI000B0A8248|nr:putative quinol monooxygenase [Sphingomonas sp. Root710]
MAIAAAALAILCYVSPNPSPTRLLISGPPAQVSAMSNRAAGTGTFHLVAAAEDRGIAFARFQLAPNALYRDVGGILFEMQRSDLMTTMDQAVDSCRDGRAEDIGDPHATPIRVGLLGEKAAVEPVRAALPWARFSPLRLAGGRTGWSFAPGDDDGIAYQLFVARAAAAKFPGVEVVLLGTPPAPGKAGGGPDVPAAITRESTPMYGLMGRMIAQPGQRDALIAILLEGTGDMPGCLSYVVARDAKDENAIWVTEVWDSKEAHAASLKLPAVQAAIAKGRPLIAGFDSYTETSPAGGVGLPR